MTKQDLLDWEKCSNHTSPKVEWDGEQGKACRQIIEARLAKNVGRGNRHHKKSRVSEENRITSWDCSRSLGVAGYKSYVSLSGRISKIM